MNEKNVKIEERSFRFAKGIIKIVVSLPNDNVKFVLGKQLMRSGTAIGANVEEAQGGISRADFIHSMNIAKKEARETAYWLRLLLEFDFSKKQSVEESLNECNELLKMLTAIVKTSQKSC
ncbi:MAG: four helix bundle protein [Candidatus Omnitrophota bacterium]